MKKLSKIYVPAVRFSQQATHNDTQYNDIMREVWNAVGDKPAKWRRIFKARAAAGSSSCRSSVRSLAYPSALDLSSLSLSSFLVCPFFGFHYRHG